jgi:hypothetical protein
MKNRMRRLLTHMHSRGRIDQAALDFALSELDHFRFHREGDPPTLPPQIPGSAGELPFSTTLGWEDDWEQWNDAAFEDAFDQTAPEQL